MALYLWQVENSPRSRKPIKYLRGVDLLDPDVFFDGKGEMDKK